MPHTKRKNYVRMPLEVPFPERKTAFLLPEFIFCKETRMQNISPPPALHQLVIFHLKIFSYEASTSRLPRSDFFWGGIDPNSG